MAATTSTNASQGLGYQTGYFSGITGQPVDQSFFNTAFAGHINTNKIYRNAYNCNITGMCNMSSWLEEFGGTEYDCHTDWTNLEYNGFRRQIRAAAGVTIPTRAGGTGNITLSSKDHFVSGQYVLPQVGNTVVLTPSGYLADVTAVTHATANDTIITVKQRSTTAAQQVVALGDEMLILDGKILTDCVCPSGQFKFRDMPLEIDLSMIDVAAYGNLCGDALEKCQFLKIPFLDDNGDEIAEEGRWFTIPEQDMYRDLERRKHYEKLLNPNFGVVPNLRARGIKFSPASTSEITTDDIRDLKSQLDLYGIAGREFAFFCGNKIFSQFQRMLLAAGVVQLNYAERPMNDCSWLNMEYCGIRVEGLTLHIYDDCSFSSGKELGSVGMNFPSSAIGVPLWNRDVSRTERSIDGFGGRNGYTEKMFTTVYFQSIQGRKYDTYVDSNGMWGKRNTFGAGCKNMEWSAETRFTLETYCMNSWLYIGLS